MSAGNVVRDLSEGLLTEDAQGELVPGTASSWTQSNDGLRYRFEIRRDARWSNGDPVTAQDFVYALRRAVDPRTASPSAALLAPIRNANAIMAGQLEPDRLAVVAEDAKLLQIELERPTPYFLSLLVVPVAFPVHEVSVEGNAAAFARAGALISNGAFTLEDWTLQSHIGLKRNPFYWNADDVRIDRVQHIVTEDLNAELQRFRTGELHITEQVPARQIEALSDALRAQLRVADYLGVYYYGFNLTRPPFAGQPKLRQALNLAVDRDIITRKVLGSGEKPAYSWLPPGISGTEGQTPDWARWTREQRLAEARRLYAEAGYGLQRPLRIELRYNTHEYHQKIATVVAAMWKQFLGVETTLYNEETKVFLQHRRERKLTQVFRGSWIADYNDASSFLDLLLSTNPRNDTGYASAQYDALLLQAAQGPEDQRPMRLAEAEQRMLDDTPVIPLYFYVTKHLVASDVIGWHDNPADHHYSRDLDLATP